MKEHVYERDEMSYYTARARSVRTCACVRARTTRATVSVAAPVTDVTGPTLDVIPSLPSPPPPLLCCRQTAVITHRYHLVPATITLLSLDLSRDPLLTFTPLA